jgi:intraflagellar transport protein 172
MAEKLYVEAGCTREAVDMYNNAGKWDMAHKVSLIFICFMYATL